MYIHGKILVSTILNREQLNVKSDDTDTNERIAVISLYYIYIAKRFYLLSQRNKFALAVGAL